MQELEELFDEEIYNLQAQTIIVIPEKWEDLNEEDVSLLTKILLAVKLTLSQIRIINTPLFVLDDFNLPPGSKIIAFGSSIDPGIGTYKLTLQNGHQLIQADSLNKLTDATKKDLWTQLKVMFSS